MAGLCSGYRNPRHLGSRLEAPGSKRLLPTHFAALVEAAPNPFYPNHLSVLVEATPNPSCLQTIQHTPASGLVVGNTARALIAGRRCGRYGCASYSQRLKLLGAMLKICIDNPTAAITAARNRHPERTLALRAGNQTSENVWIRWLHVEMKR